MNDTLKLAGRIGAELGAAKAENEKLRGLLQQVVDCQAEHYGDGCGLHLSMITLAGRIKDALSQQAEPNERELEALGLGYPFSKEDAVKLWYKGFRTEPIALLEVWEAIGHDVGIDPSKHELMDSLRNMEAICRSHGYDFPCPAAPAPAQDEQPAVFWVLFDATGPERFIKKDVSDGTLAFFDSEDEAQRAKRRHPGTDYKLVEYYRAPNAKTAPRCQCCGYLVTDSEHRGCLRAATPSPAKRGEV